MIVSVVVSTEGTLREALARAGAGIRDGKKLMRVDAKDIAVYGPRKGFVGGALTMLQYRLTDREYDDPCEMWSKAPDEVVKAGCGYGAADR